MNKYEFPGSRIICGGCGGVTEVLFGESYEAVWERGEGRCQRCIDEGRPIRAALTVGQTTPEAPAPDAENATPVPPAPDDPAAAAALANALARGATDVNPAAPPEPPAPPEAPAPSTGKRGKG